MRFKRLIASVSAGFDDFVTRVENHESVADNVIEEVRQAAAKVRVQHARVTTQIERFQRQRRELETEEQRWNDRALSVAEDDKPRALECVRRARQADMRQSAIEAQLDEHHRLADDLANRLRDLEQRLADLQLKRTALSSRSARARTLRAVGDPGCSSIDQAFDRWETAVLADEYLDEVDVPGSDPLAQDFDREEEAADLEARLAELRATRGEAS